MMKRIEPALRYTWRTLVRLPYKILIRMCLALPKTKTLVIIKYESIGDYVIFRPYLRAIRKSAKFKDYKIVLLGNSIYRELAESFDGDSIDHFYWFDIRKIFLKKSHIWKSFLHVAAHRPELIFIAVHSRLSHFESWIGEFRNVGKVAPFGDCANMSIEDKNKLDKNYDLLLDEPGPSVHETLRFEAVTKCLLREDFQIDRCFSRRIFDHSNPKQIGVFLGGGMKEKLLSESLIVQLIRNIVKEFKEYRVLLLGGKEVEQQGDDIVKEVNCSQISNLCGKTKLSELTAIVKSLSLLISHDSCAIHIAVAVETPCIAILQGMNHPRFAPYPDQALAFRCVYPESIRQWLLTTNEAIMPRSKWVNLQLLSLEDGTRIVNSTMEFSKELLSSKLEKSSDA